MKSSNRPLSPHLQIYKLPLSARLSILHRLTGLALTAGAFVLVLWLLALAFNSGLAITIYSFFTTTIGKVFLIGWTFTFFYHFFFFFCHLLWDTANGLKVECINRSGITVILVSTVLTILVWTLGV